jgi:hypothetical protein
MKKNKSIQPYYGGDNGIMNYKGLDLNPISDEDVYTIIKYAKDALNGNIKNDKPKVTIIEEVGNNKEQKK